MVWTQRKKGVHSGRTLRRDAFSRTLDKHGLIVKYPKNATQFSTSKKESILEERYGLVDGFSLSAVPNRFDFGNGVEFSLGKRKRWLLPELVQNQVYLDGEEVSEEEDEDQELNVCIVERHSHPEFPRARGDCLSFYSDKDGQLLKPKNRYSFLTDIRHLNKNDRPSEICYEICRPPPSTSWPSMKEGQFVYETYDMMGKVESKGQKSKSFRWGFHGVKDLSMNSAKGILSEMPKLRHAKTVESKIRTVPRKQFSNAVKEMDSESNGRSTSFPMGQYIDGLLKGNESAKEMGSESFPCIPSSAVKKYGKGCAVYADSEPSPTPANQPVVTPVYLDPTFSLEEPKLAVTVNVALEDLEETRLMSEWGDIYSEGGTLPRKFTLNITNLLPRKNPCFSSIMLFEVDEKLPKAEASLKTTVSMIPIALGSDMPDLTKAVYDFDTFCFLVTEANLLAPLRIGDIVDTAIEVITVASGEAKEPSKPSCSKITIKSLGFLNNICGWESEAFTVDGAKQWLQDEYLKERPGSCHGKDKDSLSILLSMDCGICFETFEDDGTLLTSLTDCGHAFCSDCWKGHLTTQINQGTNCIRCPGQGCKTKVDDTIIMSMVPAWYNKFLNMKLNKELEASPDWKWCPANGCRKVVKATSPSLGGMTVLCDCGHAWCFHCRQPSHWPATCKESENFEKKGEVYREVLQQDAKDLITSVMVKNCPKCDYPIEKHFGCQFMMCALCQTHFCWNCSTPANYGHKCNKTETDDLTEVELSYKSKRYQFEKLLNIVVKSIKARVPKQLAAKGTKARALETGVTSYKSFSSKIPKEALIESRVSQQMEQIVESGISETVREAVEFEFQAHLVLEGFAKKASVSRAHYKSGLQTMSQLAFVVDRIESLCQDPFLLCKDGRIHRLEKLIAVGKDCILTLKKCCTGKKC